ncbi:conserved hypothetical protein [Methanolacinia petrolearia DSM 11571]|uniref:Uncharacterized protein n=1 Tax=Methanolacinia petrolearia (strain DSM 11571 / OCM 486 / SEBR 4847) TaxID=679926 RepID=E1RJN1_METP4|nr:hypothetical protein [Methanolacinia petrolearia]ADN35678.1 conserved hypothetical protein [Methanolacinia petrolearia DSM 11571]
MSGKIIQMIDKLIELKSGGNPTVATTTRTKLILKGINPQKYDSHSDDDPEVIAKIRSVATEMGIKL